MGDSALTVMVSSRVPTFRSALMVATNVPVSSTPSRFTELNPVNENVTAYVPGRRSTIRYWPEPSVIAERTFSMRTGLAASTVTPGSTAPDASFTTPAMDACAYTTDGTRIANRIPVSTLTNLRIAFTPLIERASPASDAHNNREERAVPRHRLPRSQLL